MNHRALFSLVILFGCLSGGSVTQAAPILIGYTNCLSVTNTLATTAADIGTLKWYFAHASVGGNMMDGVADLRALGTNHYRFRGGSASSTPPATTQTGVIYEHNRGNPGWQAKFNQFQTCVSNGWRFPRVNLAMNKLCYIDPDANLTAYLNSMSALESAFPETVFVYMTIPLMNATDSDNRLRNVFNDGVRDWVRAGHRVLFDIADIEAHDTTGAACTYTSNGRVCQRLCPAYTDDGGHLNTPGRQLVARGFYALATALLAADRDADGLSDARELIAGTVPTDVQSNFQFTQARRPGAGGFSLQWTSAANRLYTLQRGLNVSDPASFSNLLEDAPATPPLNSYVDAPPGTGPFFYRLRVRQ